MNRNIQTLEEFRKQELRHLPNATGELSNLLRDIALAAKRVNVEVNKAGLVDIFGETGSVNIQGERVQRLDDFANNQFMHVLQRGISCSGVVSEEVDDFVCLHIPESFGSVGRFYSDFSETTDEEVMALLKELNARGQAA